MPGKFCNQCEYFSKKGMLCFCPQTEEEFCELAEYVAEGEGAYVSPDFLKEEIFKEPREIGGKSQGSNKKKVLS